MPKINPNDVIEQVRSYERELFFQGDPEEEFDFQDLIENKFFIIQADGKKTSLIMNPAQEIIWHHILDDYLNNRPMFFIIMKIRQLGCSTLIDGVITALLFMHSNRRALITANKDILTKRLYEICKIFYKNLPDSYRRSRPLTTPNPKAAELVFQTPHDSYLYLQTAKDKDTGRGDTLQYYHGSEAAFYPYLVDNRQGVDAAVHPLPGNLKIWESTPPKMGQGTEFKGLWRQAEAGKNNLTPIFLSFPDVKHEFPNYFIPFAPGEKLALNESEQRYYNKHKDLLTPEQMKWIQAKLDEYNGNFASLNQEFPISIEVAFMQEGSAWFNLETLKKLRRTHERAPEYLVSLEFAQQVECASAFDIKKGYLDEGCGWSGFFKEAERPKACPNCTSRRLTSRLYPGCPVLPTKLLREDLPGKYFYIEVYEEPDYDEDYLISMDVGEGVGANFSVIHVWRVVKFASHIILKQVAHYYNNHVNPLDAAIHCFMMGQWYNWALILVERNNPGQSTTRGLQDGISQMEATWGGYPYLYYETKQIEKDKEETERIGWNTNRKSKSQILHDQQKYIMEERIIFHSGRTYDEHEGFYWDPEKNDYVQQFPDPLTRRCHDDEVMSAAMAWPCLDSLLKNPRLLPRAKSGGF